MQDQQVEVMPGSHAVARVAGAVVLVAHRSAGRPTAGSPAVRALVALAELVHVAATRHPENPGATIARDATRWLMADPHRSSADGSIDFGILSAAGPDRVAIFLHGAVVAAVAGETVEFFRGRDAAFTVDRTADIPSRAVALFVDEPTADPDDETAPELPAERGIGRLVEGIAEAGGAIVWTPEVRAGAAPASRGNGVVLGKVGRGNEERSGESPSSEALQATIGESNTATVPVEEKLWRSAQQVDVDGGPASAAGSAAGAVDDARTGDVPERAAGGLASDIVADAAGPTESTADADNRSTPAPIADSAGEPPAKTRNGDRDEPPVATAAGPAVMDAAVGRDVGAEGREAGDASASPCGPEVSGTGERSSEPGAAAHDRVGVPEVDDGVASPGAVSRAADGTREAPATDDARLGAGFGNANLRTRTTEGESRSANSGSETARADGTGDSSTATRSAGRSEGVGSEKGRQISGDVSPSDTGSSAGENTPGDPAGGNTAASPAGGNISGNPAGGNIAGSPTEGNNAGSSGEISSAGSPAGENDAAGPTGGDNAGSPAAGNNAGGPAGEKSETAAGSETASTADFEGATAASGTGSPVGGGETGTSVSGSARLVGSEDRTAGSPRDGNHGQFPHRTPDGRSDAAPTPPKDGVVAGGSVAEDSERDEERPSRTDPHHAETEISGRQSPRASVPGPEFDETADSRHRADAPRPPTHPTPHVNMPLPSADSDARPRETLPDRGTPPLDAELRRRTEATAKGFALTVKVRGFKCARAHPTDPRSAFCSVCGMPVDQTQPLIEVVRPPLGILVLDDGATHLLETDTVLGRDPEKSDSARRGLTPIRVPDMSGGMSRAHIELLLVEWDVTLVDRGSTNGTRIRGPGFPEWVRVSPFQPVVLIPGTEILIGSRMVRFESAAPPPFGS